MRISLSSQNLKNQANGNSGAGTVSSEYFGDSANVFRLFERIYEGQIEPVVSELFPVRVDNEGLHRTLKLGKNHYHTGVICILGDLLSVDKNLTARLAAIAEYSWTTLIALDDLGDGDQIRRGAESLWVQRGVLYASQSSLAAAMDIIRVIQSLADDKLLPAAAATSYARMMSRVARGQILRETMTLRSSRLSFYKMMLAITSHLRFTCGLILASHGGMSRAFKKISRNLGICASLKNDLEDIFPPSSAYKPGGIDLAGYQVTYPIAFLYNFLDEGAQKYLSTLLAEAKNDPQAFSKVARLMTENEECLRHLNQNIARLTSSSTSFLKQSIERYFPRHSDSPHVRYLCKWIDSYNELGNSNIVAEPPTR
jgi:geranylgeranyl pyrophosphate synthase